MQIVKSSGIIKTLKEVIEGFAVLWERAVVECTDVIKNPMGSMLLKAGIIYC